MSKTLDYETTKKIALFLKDNCYGNDKIVFTNMRMAGIMYVVDFQIVNKEGKLGKLEHTKYICQRDLKPYEL